MDTKIMSDNGKHPIGLVGQGHIYQHIRRRMERDYTIIPLCLESPPQQFSTCQLIVYCTDTWSPQALQKLNRRCLLHAVPLLPVYTQFAEGIVGPCVLPGEKGCTSCAELRKLGATTSEPDRELVCYYLYGAHEPAISQLWLSSFSIATLCSLAEEEVFACIHDSDQLRTRCALFTVSLETLDCHRHTFLPPSYCPDCGEPWEDTPENAVITLRACPKQDRFTYRTRQSSLNEKLLRSTYVDDYTGLISSLTLENQNFLPVASSQLYSEKCQEHEPSPGTGCTLRSEQSKVVSMLEAVERYAGLRPRMKRSTIRASYRQLIDQGLSVLDPAVLGLHRPEQYNADNHHTCHHHLIPYHPDLSYHWVWGYSFTLQSPILVPEHYAYYDVPRGEDNPAFVYEVSNGCALGNCLEEAIFHGMAEIIERDAFLLTWYAQLSLPCLNLDSVTDSRIRLLLKHLEYQSGYTFHAWNTTLDHAIPCLWVIAIDEQGREGMPKAYIAAGSHPHPEQALLRAVRELTTHFTFSPSTYQQKRARALEMLADSTLVQTMDDHPLVYYLPEAFSRLHFLYHTQKQQTFKQAFSMRYEHPVASLDLCDDLEALISYYCKRGIDVIVVDQTTPEHFPCALRCVKIIMPGMLPMTFGEHNRRITGFPRLHQLPFTLGYRSQPLTDAEVNPYPHPFY